MNLIVRRKSPERKYFTMAVSKIGLSLINMVSAILITVLTVITAVFCVLFNNIEIATLKSSSIVATNVLQYDFESKANETEMLATLISGDDGGKRQHGICGVYG